MQNDRLFIGSRMNYDFPYFILRVLHVKTSHIWYEGIYALAASSGTRFILLDDESRCAATVSML